MGLIYPIGLSSAIVIICRIVPCVHEQQHPHAFVGNPAHKDDTLRQGMLRALRTKGHVGDHLKLLFLLLLRWHDVAGNYVPTSGIQTTSGCKEKVDECKGDVTIPVFLDIAEAVSVVAAEMHKHALINEQTVFSLQIQLVQAADRIGVAEIALWYHPEHRRDNGTS